MEEFLKIGLIVKPQGIRGELKLTPLTDDLTRFIGLKKVYIDGAIYSVLTSKLGGGVVFLALSGISDRNQAETFRGKYVCVRREDAIPLKKDTYFIADIIGCALKTETTLIGEVVDVTSAKTDIFTVRTVDGKTLRFPFLKDLLVKVDVENKEITVKEKRLGEVGLYED